MHIALTDLECTNIEWNAHYPDRFGMRLERVLNGNVAKKVAKGFAIVLN